MIYDEDLSRRRPRKSPLMLDVFSIVEWVSAGDALGGAAEYLRKLTYEKVLTELCVKRRAGLRDWRAPD